MKSIVWLGRTCFCFVLCTKKKVISELKIVHMWEKIGNIIAVSHSVLGCSRIWFTVAAILCTMDYGRPMKPFLLKSINFWASADKIGQISSGAFGVFSSKLSAPIWVQWVPCTCFPSFNHFSYKKLSLYIHIPNIYLELWFEFGPQRIKDLAFMCPYSVLCTVAKAMWDNIKEMQCT